MSAYAHSAALKALKVLIDDRSPFFPPQRGGGLSSKRYPILYYAAGEITSRHLDAGSVAPELVESQSELHRLMMLADKTPAGTEALGAALLVHIERALGQSGGSSLDS